MAIIVENALNADGLARIFSDYKTTAHALLGLEPETTSRHKAIDALKEAGYLCKYVEDWVVS